MEADAHLGCLPWKIFVGFWDEGDRLQIEVAKFPPRDT